MQFQEVFLIVEHPPADPQVEPRDVLDRAFGDEVGVKLGPDLGDQAAQFGPVILRVQVLDAFDPAGAVEVAFQDRQFDLGFQRQAGADDDGLDVVVEQDRDQRVLQAGHDHRLVDELILGRRIDACST